MLLEKVNYFLLLLLFLFLSPVELLMSYHVEFSWVTVSRKITGGAYMLLLHAIVDR